MSVVQISNIALSPGEQAELERAAECVGDGSDDEGGSDTDDSGDDDDALDGIAGMVEPAAGHAAHAMDASDDTGGKWRDTRGVAANPRQRQRATRSDDNSAAAGTASAKRRRKG